jgi:DNA polymerase IV
VARGHSRERTFQRDLTEPEQIDEAIRQLVGEVLVDLAGEGRPAVRLTVKVRYTPFFTRTFSRTLPEPTSDGTVILAETRALVAKRQAGRPIRLLGLRAEMTMPEPDEPDGDR